MRDSVPMRSFITKSLAVLGFLQLVLSAMARVYNGFAADYFGKSSIAVALWFSASLLFVAVLWNKLFLKKGYAYQLWIGVEGMPSIGWAVSLGILGGIFKWGMGISFSALAGADSLNFTFCGAEHPNFAVLTATALVLEEEVMFRHILITWIMAALAFSSMPTRRRAYIAVAVQAVLFALVHDGHMFAEILMTGILYGLMYVAWRSLLPPIAMHLSYNMLVDAYEALCYANSKLIVAQAFHLGVLTVSFTMVVMLLWRLGRQSASFGKHW